MAKPEIYFITDIETDGPIPAEHSMLSFACIAMNEAGEFLGEFSINLDTLPNAVVHPKTKLFWQSEPSMGGVPRGHRCAWSRYEWFCKVGTHCC